MDIKELPREKLIKYGPESLSDEELLAIMLSSGAKGESVYELAKRLLSDYPLKKLFQMNYQALSKIRGVKQAKGCKLIATFEIAKRSLSKEVSSKSLSKSFEVYEYLKPYYLFSDEEKLIIIYVDVKCRPIYLHELSEGNPDRIELPTKVIIKEAINYGAYGVIIAHNHPSNDVRPSKSDLSATKHLAYLLNELKLLLLDHLIMGNKTYFSFNDQNLLNFT